MGREIKRVPLDFEWPLNEVWEGYQRPAWRDCPGEDCQGGSTTAAHWLDVIAHLLLMVGESGVSSEQLHPWLVELPLSPRVKPGPDAAELSTGLAGRAPRPSMGHDAIDRWKATSAIIRAAGLPESWGTCQTCGGEGIHPDDQEAAEAWEPTEPPTGDGWQVWETVSEGSPISPVFAEREALIDWLCSPAYTWGISTPMDREQAERFVDAAWAPSMVGSTAGLVPGEQWVGGESA